MAAIAPETLQDNIIQGGGHWFGASYGQGNLCRLIFDMSKVRVLSTTFDVSRVVILVALALHWDSEVPNQKYRRRMPSKQQLLCVMHLVPLPYPFVTLLRRRD